MFRKWILPALKLLSGIALLLIVGDVLISGELSDFISSIFVQIDASSLLRLIIVCLIVFIGFALMEQRLSDIERQLEEIKAELRREQPEITETSENEK